MQCQCQWYLFCVINSFYSLKQNDFKPKHSCSGCFEDVLVIFDEANAILHLL